jgi:hypothetical protein
VVDKVLIQAEGDDPNGVQEVAHFDQTTGDLIGIERVQDVEPVLEWCRGRYNEGIVNRHCEFRLVGSYPPNIIEIFAGKNGLTFDQVIGALGKDKDLTNRLLGDSDLSHFRTLAGRY